MATVSALVLTTVLGAAAPTSDVSISTVDGLREALRTATAGTRIRLAPGEYEGPFVAVGLRGTAEEPILIEGADPQRPPVLHGGNECLHLSGVAHVVLRNLVLARGTINCLNIDDGERFGTPSHHVVLDGLTAREITAPGNRDGIKLSGVDDFVVRGCTVEGWGDGGSAIDMMGCHRGIIADSTFRHRDGKGATGIQAKGGTCDVLVHRCRFKDAGQRAINLGGYADKFLRPPDADCQARRVVAVGNTFVGSDAAVAFVGADACVASFNTIYRPRAWVLRILQEARQPRFVRCRDGEFRGNLVVWRWRELNTTTDVRGGPEPETFCFDGNWWYCEDRPSRSHPDLPVADQDGVVGRDPALIIDGLDIQTKAAPDHGALSPHAADLFRQLGPKLAPWAYEQLKRREGDGR